MKRLLSILACALAVLLGSEFVVRGTDEKAGAPSAAKRQKV